MTTQPPHPDHAQPDRDPTTSPTPDSEGSDPLALTGLVAAGALDVVPGDPPVPISVWRVAGVNWPANSGAAHGLTPRLAALLIGSYTRRGDTVVDLTSDPTIAGAAGAGARTYLPATDLDEMAALDHVAGRARLVVLRWPRPDVDATSATAVTDLFTGCRRLLARDGYTVVVLTPTPPGTPYVEHARLVIPAAHRAGLGYLQHIVAVTAPIAGERPPRAAAPADAATLRAATHVRVHLDLLVFVLRGGRHA